MLRALAKFGVHNPVVANLIVFTFIAAGLVFGISLRREFFPEVRPNLVLISAPYPGANPQEIEDALVLKIEDAIAELDDIEEINSSIREGGASVRVEFAEGVNIEDAVAEVKREIDALQDLPADAERIVVAPLEPNLPVIALSLASTQDERTLKDTIRALQRDLESLKSLGMGDIVLGGIRADELSVEIPPERLLELNMSLPQIASIIGQALQEVPAGSVKSSTSNITVRTMGAPERTEQIEQIVLKTTQQGSAITVGDVARVSRSFADVDLVTRLNGQTAVSMTAFKVGDQDAVQIADMVRAYTAGLKRQPLELTLRERIAQTLSRGDSVPPRVAAYNLGLARTTPPGEIVLHTDLSRFITGRLELLSRNAFWGGIFVFLALLLLLNVRVALWVTAGLIISILGTLAFMAAVGISLNLLTMFGLIIVVGLLVDDGIVVAENITARHEAGEDANESAINGTSIVAWPVVATVLTTIFAFSSLALVQGQIGDLLAVLPQVVIVALAVSLIESLFILPSHMAHSMQRADKRASKQRNKLSVTLSRFDDRRTAFLQHYLVPKYLRFLRFCLHFRYLTLVFFIAMLSISIAMVMTDRPAFTFLGTQDAETVRIELAMPVGTPIDRTQRIASRIEQASMAQPEVTTTLAIIGARSDADGVSQTEQSNIAQIWLELVPAEDRDRTSEQIRQSIRDRVGELPSIKSLRIEEEQGGPGGPDLNYTVVGNSPAQILAVADQIKSLLATVTGVEDISDDADAGQRELRIDGLRPGADRLGLTRESIGRQIRGWVFGLEAHTFAAPDEDVDVRVKLDEATRENLAAIERQHIFTPPLPNYPDGTPVPLEDVAQLKETRSFATINRLDRQRAIAVTAEVNTNIVLEDGRAPNPEKISAEIDSQIRQIQRNNPGVKVLPRGRQKEVSDSLATLPLGLLVSVVAIYIVLAWLFGSYVQPIIVLLAVPYAIIGVVWGHLIMGFDLTLLSLIGFIALTGVVVNDSLIFIEFYNHKRREHVGVFEAAVEAGRARFRAIILTTTTTVLGLSPLMLEQSFQARFLIPMAITISFGLLAATFVVLLVTPCLLVIGSDIRRVATFLWTGRMPSRTHHGRAQ